MLRFLARFLGLWLIAAALVAAVVDAAKSIAASAPVLTPFGEVWFRLAPVSLSQAQAAVERHLGAPWLWDLITEWLLTAPAWLILLLFGAALTRLGRRRRRMEAEESLA